MKATVQARLDAPSRATLRRLVRRLGRTPSEVVRDGLRLLDACTARDRGARIVGLGRFSSGVEDLGSNKGHLEGFGR
jgi:hypothetical protein